MDIADLDKNGMLRSARKSKTVYFFLSFFIFHFLTFWGTKCGVVTEEKSEWLIFKKSKGGCEWCSRFRVKLANFITISVKWIIQIVQNMGFSNDVFYDALLYLDTILCSTSLMPSDLKYYMAGCLWISAKMDMETKGILRSFWSQEDFESIVRRDHDIISLLSYNFIFSTSELSSGVELRQLMEIRS
jgi:hypothetical protein